MYNQKPTENRMIQCACLDVAHTTCSKIPSIAIIGMVVMVTVDMAVPYPVRVGLFLRKSFNIISCS